MVDKKQLLAALNWDSSVDTEELLSLVEGKIPFAGGISRDALFLRSLERMPWHNLLFLWNGAEACSKLYTERVRRGLRNENLRRKFDFVFGILRNEPVQAPEWGSEYCERLRNTFLSNRWNRT